MAVSGEEDFGEEHKGPRRNREGLILMALAAAGRALEREADHWFVWLPVLFAGGIIAYFALDNERRRRPCSLRRGPLDPNGVGGKRARTSPVGA